ncbi:MAG: MFS transporter [Bryobacterales bacterium]|nr:MFS transporter [Bryobacterales bacterium]MBV9400324.1 MFS transporter [Bryobacterales bacterium]
MVCNWYTAASMRRWSLVCLLSVALAFAYTHRTNISFALADPNFIAFLRLTDTDRGTLNSAFFWTYGLLQIPAGSLVDRWGAKWPLSVGLFCWCLLSAATGLANTFWTVLALRLLLGLFEAVITPAGLRWIRDHMEERRRGLATGIFFAGSKYGPAVAAPVAAWLIKEHGWRSMFLNQGLYGLLWLAPWIVFASSGRGPRAKSVEADAALPFFSLFASRVMWGTLVGTFAYNYFVFFAMSWLPAYFVEQRHLSLSSMGIYTGFSYGGTAAVAILAGLAADWMIERGADPLATRRGFTIAGLLVASTVVLGALSQSTTGAIFFSILSMSGLGLATANYWSLPQTVMPKAMAGRVGGAQNMALTAAGIIAPIATGWLKQISGGYAAPMALIGVLLLIGIGAYVFLVRQPEAAETVTFAREQPYIT